ncbi:hypothetical protein KGQ20_04705 [Catenulispora sp. NF23]|uniref:hypothetical protein n=1 Tax=Catenulispora pinistramenti TaxID=2705254 RepID=UPI001BA77A78|nr:hypothetical protein [Catenulispora pinistramenti]MBS2532064.1 hypothetical protein [Catenulispora pinistramenti]
MNRTAVRTVAAAAALAATAIALPSASATGTPASGSVALTASNAFLTSALRSGIAAVPLPTATGSYNGATGATATFPVTGGNAVLARYYGSVTLGGGIAFADALTGKIVCFHQVSLSARSQELSAVPDGGTTPVNLFEFGGDTVISNIGVKPETLTGDADIPADGAAYLDQALGTTFFTANQAVGSLSATYTPAS